jgi:uncharacterized damage-inducible protein DinB
MLRDSVIHSILQISDILAEVKKLPKDKAQNFYCDLNAGKHVRHVLDHFLAFLSISDEGILDYNARNRDSVVETDFIAAQEQLNIIMQDFESFPDEERNLSLISEVDVSDTQNEYFTSNTSREMLYLINHTMHHAAYINLIAKHCGVALPDHIGVAPSTASYLRSANA